MLSLGQVKTVIALTRNLVLAALLYACIFVVFHSIQTRHVAVERHQLAVAFPQDDPQPIVISEQAIKIIGNSSAGLRIKFAGLPQPVVINPYANSFNRPPSTITPQDAYLGPRPHVDTEVYFPTLLEACRGSYEKAERIRKVAACLNYLSTKQGDYSRIPPKRMRASNRDPRRSGFFDSDGHGNTQPAYTSEDEAASSSKLSRGICAGPIIPYHVYWHGPLTWRLELFVKSYLHTQNLQCSRLHVWLDDDNADTVNRTLTYSKAFARFIPLVNRGDIVLEKWKMPTKFPLLSTDDNTDGLGYTHRPALIEGTSDVDIGHGLVMDRSGRQWLTLSQKQLSFLPPRPLDFIRLATLHKYGGVFLSSDLILLRDLRPLALPSNRSFALRHGSRAPMGEYYPAVMSMQANSSVSSYLLRGGVRMGMNFHSLVLGMMAWKDGRNKDLTTIENPFFNPLWPGNHIEGPCPTPCHRDDPALIFEGRNGSIQNEWRGYGAGFVKAKEPKRAHSKLDTDEENQEDDEEAAVTAVENAEQLTAELQETAAKSNAFGIDFGVDTEEASAIEAVGHVVEGFVRKLSSKQSPFRGFEMRRLRRRRSIEPEPEPPMTDESDDFMDSMQSVRSNADPPPDSSTVLSDEDETLFMSEEETLREMGIVAEYRKGQDEYPPTNRTMENFYRGAFAYQIHDQWHKHPAPNSWIDVIRHAHDGFFQGRRTNMYGEYWKGPEITAYNRWPEFL